MRRFYRFISVLIITFGLGTLIPVIVYETEGDFNEVERAAIISLLDNPIDRLFTLAYKSEEFKSGEYESHILVKSIFGITYADIYVGGKGEIGSSAYIERRFIFRE